MDMGKDGVNPHQMMYSSINDKFIKIWCIHQIVYSSLMMYVFIQICIHQNMAYWSNDVLITYNLLQTVTRFKLPREVWWRVAPWRWTTPWGLCLLFRAGSQLCPPPGLFAHTCQIYFREVSFTFIISTQPLYQQND